MSQRSPPGLRIGSQCGKVSGYSGTNILAKYQRSPQLKTNPTIGTHNQSNSHRCSRCLYNHGKNCTDDNK